MILFFVIALVLAVGIANFARQRYETALQIGRRIAPLPQTAGEIAREFLDSFDASDVKIVEHNGFITDYFDPKRRCLFLQRAVMNGKNEAAWGLALHEAAHGVQLRGMAGALEMRASNIKLTRYIPTLAALLIVLLGILKRPPLAFGWRVLAVIWAIVMVLNAMSLPIEFHASKLARDFLERKLRSNSEALDRLSAVLSGVAWRDTAAFLRSPMYCFSALLPIGGRMRPK
jgi:Zn-dependent membrane protease YugP